MTTYRGVIAAGLLAFCTGLESFAVQVPGTWVNVTPAGAITAAANLGATTILVDPVRHGDVYANFQFNGTWKSTDYGVTFIKVSTGANADAQNSGAQWHAIIDPNPDRDPATPPTMFCVQGYGQLGIWKSTDGGVGWVDTWNNNVYKSDGITNIYSDVGRDEMGLACLGTHDINHILTYPHSYWGTGGNNGYFLTNDGGATWKLIPAPFDFQPHSDAVWAIDSATWIATISAPWPNGTILRSTDQGATWDSTKGIGSSGLGYNSFCKAGSSVYAGSNYIGGLYKSTDNGKSWAQVRTSPVWAIGWVGASATRIYTVGKGGISNPIVMSAPLSNDSQWTFDTLYDGNAYGCYDPGMMFDGTHYVILAAHQLNGLYRYVEPGNKAYMALSDSIVQVSYDVGQSKTTQTAKIAVVNMLSSPHYSGTITVSNKRPWLTVSVDATKPDSQVIANSVNPASFSDAEAKYYDTVTVNVPGADVTTLSYQVIVWVRQAAVLSSLVMLPSDSGSIPSGKPFKFTVTGCDQYSLALAPQPAAVWTATGGSLHGGTFTPSASAASGVVTTSMTLGNTTRADTARFAIVNCTAGLTYDYYAHVWIDSTRYIPPLVPTSNGVAVNVSVNPTSTIADSFALRFTGLVMIPATGSYTFYTNSDDGSALFVDGAEVVDNDSHHGPTEKSGTVTLGWGLHALTVLYFEETGGQSLAVNWQGPGIAKGAIPDSLLYHNGSTVNATVNDHPALLPVRHGLSIDRRGVVVTVPAGEKWVLEVFGLNGARMFRTAGAGRAIIPLAASTALTNSGIARLRTEEGISVRRICRSRQ